MNHLHHRWAIRHLNCGLHIAPLAGWMGHKDGGILDAKDYGHLVPDHSSKQAGKVLA